MKKSLSLENQYQAGPTTVVVMVTSVDSEGKANIITLGEYMPVGYNPPRVCIGIAKRQYSHDLIANSGEFVVNVPPIGLEKQMHLCGTKSGRDIDKFAETGLTPIPAEKVKPPLIEECYGHIECKVVRTLDLKDYTLFIGEVVAARVDEDVLKNGKLDPLKAKPILNKNYVYYTVTGEE
jgi:flavin reductase (DIM6/NTAB) family NADH-FMN oxidoreductase RutF